MIENEIVYFKRIYNFGVDHFFHRSYIFFLFMKNVIKNKYFWFPKEIYERRRKCLGQNCSPLKDIQINHRLFFSRRHGFRFNRKKRNQK